MVKLTFTIFVITGAILLATRYAILYSRFLNDGIMEGIQTCKSDDDCIWAPTGCCGCDEGGREILINKGKETTYKLLIKPFCFKEQTCPQKDACNYEEVFCDQICKFGKKTVTKPLLTR